MEYRLIVMGTSYGGMKALGTILPALPENFPLPIAIVQHLSADSDSYMVGHLNSVCKIQVKEAEEKELLQSGVAYIAPEDYHLLVEDDMSLSLAADNKVNFSRPAIDVLFETAAFSLGPLVIGVILTGANTDGSIGLKKIKEGNGLAVVQSPETSVASAMVVGAIEKVAVDYILPLSEIAPFLIELTRVNRSC
ncbi:MAG: chemotaxis protein CheB [Desulfobulbaceae bacterium]|nr:chemotaxis protein CheB [Desulfobulbaceae bacterium]